MAIDERSTGLETSADSLGHEHPDAEEYRALAEDLRTGIRGDVSFDEYAQVLYATDGSIYRAEPAGVVLPQTIEDVQHTVETAAEHGVPILPRGTGSSLGGPTVGPGCVVVDFTRYMDDIVDVDPDDQRAVVQPGVVQDHLDNHLEGHGLKFAPDPASSNRSTIVGGIGNNSTGAHSVRYGITDAYTEELDVVLSDGSLIHTEEIVLDSDEWDEKVSGDGLEAQIYETTRRLVEDHEAEIDEKYPDLKRSVSGYNLQKVIYENDAGEEVINLSKLFVGAEGTLGVIVEAEVSLVTLPEETALVLYCFDDLVETMQAVPEALQFDVGAVELMDDEVFALAADSTEYAQYVEMIPEGTTAALMLEFDSELVDDFEAAIADTNDHFVENGDAFHAIEAYTDEDQADIWKLRKAAIPLLMGMQGDPKPYPFIEDATVPPEELSEYVFEFEEVLEDHDTSAAYFAHAGSGTLHIRPILNLKDGEGIEKMHSITEDVTDLVLEHYGSFSGEHGDGMARTEFNPKMYGEELWTAFKELKTAFDPDWHMHPGNVVYRDGPEDIGPDSDRGVGADMRANLRYGTAYKSIEPQTTLDFEDEGGFSHLVELCNGCGTCRQTDSEVMCPTYRAAEEEIQSTRGRANLLRSAMNGSLDEDELLGSEFGAEVMDLCVGCKGCEVDCPSGVDMAKMKAEVEHASHERDGASLRDRIFANIDSLSRLGSMFAPLSNLGTKLPGVRTLMESQLGIESDRELPTFERESFATWLANRGSRVSEREADRTAVIFPDTYTNYNHPEVGKAAVRVLEAANVRVELADVRDSGRPAYSKGFIDTAREEMVENARTIAPDAEHKDVVLIEPSDAVMFQSDALDLVPSDHEARDHVESLADNSYGLCEYLDAFRLDENADWAGNGGFAYHGHCHQKAKKKDHHAVGVLRRAGYGVSPVDSTCCGMAGSFGYETEHYSMSREIGEQLAEQVAAQQCNRVVAPGASCRSQLESFDEEPVHPAVALDDALPE
mgnify:CR=1 FL=1